MTEVITPYQYSFMVVRPGTISLLWLYQSEEINYPGKPPNAMDLTGKPSSLLPVDIG
jgi:hypothetical protein